MLKINVQEDFDQIKIAQERHIKELIEKINEKNILKNETELEINIENCVTDYPATPKLIDFFLNHLSNQNGEKKIHIKLNGLGNKQLYILYILVLEGDFFEIHNKIDNEDEIGKWIGLINRKLIENNIILTVTYTTNGQRYDYGKKD